ncbi:hypothetical protein FC40_GL001561 [Ligilactobacillus hayakitensis DSM 18933 = JCM 14209]|uniref:N-acetyltransferase domain-containing protein n=1 Tax=Ligilactobacillus hayakitensis DSM 18933 = JCM 14209 TaxID=1423755 RepID=A0A0R1WUZ1_9LACO|nr:GNAT family N-acetyltransferase [Ligilactobacillus hayakitensis]KRM19547.1 hypothetical protein FC40_GL001561 [Ligilactobacillus hayakitensis DSM 18933 = JCM 14209]
MLVVKPIKTKSSDFKAIKRVYEEVFPKVEQLPLWFLKMRANQNKAEFCSLYHNDQWVGFFYTVLSKKIAYVFFLAIDPKFQAKGFGSQALTAIKERYADRIIGLSAERPGKLAPNNEQRIRRQKFYARNGFTKSGFISIEKGGVNYDFLSPNEKVKAQLYPELMHRFMKGRQAYYLPIKVKEVNE